MIRTSTPRRTDLEEVSIEHRDFVVQIGPGREGDLAVRVVESPAGEGFAPFQVPRSLGEWLRLRGGAVRAARHLSTDEETSGALGPRQLGEALFRALFVGQVGELFAQSLGITGERGLRLRLRFQLDPNDSRLTLLHSLPWELLYQPDTRDFLGLSRQTPIVRSLDIPRPVPALPLPSPLRILVIPAAPAGLDPLDLQAERSQIQDAWKDLSGVEVVVLDINGTAALRQVLLESTFHVLHFMGHGEVDSITGEGVLFFGGPDGARVPVSGDTLATVLKDFRTLRLVFLNACETGRTPDGAEVDPFAGVATALVLAGVPAVIGMQLQISDEAAIAFSRTVYVRLAAGDPIDAAVSEGRQALYTPKTAEWAVPVLFTKVPDGRIFELNPPAPIQKQPRRTVGSSPRSLGWAAAFLSVGLLILLATWGREQIARTFSGAKNPELEKVRVGDLLVARYEVSNEEYLQFVRDQKEWRKDRIANSRHDGDYLKHWTSAMEYPEGLARHPVTFVPQAAARAFCRWAGGDLPSVAQWQAAAHTARSSHPWGETNPYGPAPLNFCDAACQKDHRGATDLPNFRDHYPETAPVDAFDNGKTPEGAFNLSGNVWEWTLNVSGQNGVTLGGSYLATFDECSTDEVSPEPLNACVRDGGFRCVWD